LLTILVGGNLSAGVWSEWLLASFSSSTSAASSTATTSSGLWSVSLVSLGCWKLVGFLGVVGDLESTLGHLLGVDVDGACWLFGDLGDVLLLLGLSSVDGEIIIRVVESGSRKSVFSCNFIRSLPIF
jgi:hypothetical protein